MASAVVSAAPQPPPAKQHRTEADAIGFAGNVAADFKTGPFRLLYGAVHDPNIDVLVLLRNDRSLVGTLAAFDRHFNMVLTNVAEIKSNVSGHGAGSRFISKIFLRGDGVCSVVQVPKKID